MLSLIFVGLSLLTFNSLHPTSAGNASVQDHAIIQRRRIVLRRTGEVAKQFPNRKTALVTYPVVSGLNANVLRKVRALISFKNIFDYSLAEYRDDAWLSEFSYVVNHNANSLLDITFTQSGLAAYPDEQSKHFLINLRNGELVTASDAFQTAKLSLLAALVERKLQQEIAQRRKENAELKERDRDEIDSVNDAYDALNFEIKDLDNFSVSKTGITFLYDAGFPHVIKALEPEGRYFFSFEELKPYIESHGPLGQFVR